MRDDRYSGAAHEAVALKDAAVAPRVKLAAIEQLDREVERLQDEDRRYRGGIAPARTGGERGG